MVSYKIYSKLTLLLKGMRSAFANLSMTLYIDHEPLNEIQVPKMCRIIDETKKRNDSETDKTRWDANDRRIFEDLVDSVKLYLTNEKK